MCREVCMLLSYPLENRLLTCWLEIRDQLLVSVRYTEIASDVEMTEDVATVSRLMFAGVEVADQEQAATVIFGLFGVDLQVEVEAADQGQAAPVVFGLLGVDLQVAVIERQGRASGY